MSSPRLVDLVLECVEQVSRLEDKNVKRSFRARARQIPSDIHTMGFAYAITILASRSNSGVVDLGLAIESCKDLVDKIAGLDMDSIKKGYALYAAILVHVLKRSGIVNANRFSELVRQSMNNIALDIHSLNAALWIKRFTEAYIYED